jgi:uncharacterized protein with GYD domain
MPLFVVQHKHSAETCPAGHPEMGPMLVQHVSPEHASKFGVNVRSDAVIDGQHTFVLIVEAAGKDIVKDFMTPFYQAGSVEILPASSCEQVVERAKC